MGMQDREALVKMTHPGNILAISGVCLSSFLCIFSMAPCDLPSRELLWGLSMPCVWWQCCRPLSWCLAFIFAGRRLPGGHGEALPAAHLPPQPPLAVETPGHHEEEATVLVSQLAEATCSLSPPWAIHAWCQPQAQGNRKGFSMVLLATVCKLGCCQELPLAHLHQQQSQIHYQEGKC